MAIEATVEVLHQCRLCSCQELASFLCLPNTPITGAFLKSPNDPEFLYPLELFLCPRCSLVQSQHNVNFASYYEDYAYTMAASPFALRFAETLAHTMVDRWDICRRSRVLEIGSADGLQLSFFQKLGMDVQGFEPSVVLSGAARAAGIPTVTGLFSRESQSAIPQPDRKFALILLTHVLDHLPSQREFLDSVSDLLDPRDGLLLIEVHDFEQTFTHKEYCLLQHEHTVCPTAASLQRMLASNGLELIDVGILPDDVKRAHSLMVLATPRGSRYSDRRLPDLPLGPMGDLKSLRQFASEVDAAISRVRDHIRRARAEGRKIAAFGAGGRGIMSLAAAASPGDVEYICDSSPAHRGMYTPSARVKIVAPDEPDRNPVDEIIVFSYGYMDEITSQLAQFTARGGQITSLLDILDFGHSGLPDGDRL